MNLPTRAADGHAFTTLWCVATSPAAALLFLPALGVPANRYTRFAQAMAAAGVSVAVPEWRGNDSSSLRPSRRCDWGYPELVGVDLPAAAAVARAQAPGLPWWIGGHSLGGQLAVLHAATAPAMFAGLALCATGVPHWRLYGAKKWGVRAFAASIPPVTRLVGHFPGRRLRWAGTEAGRLMRDWASSARRGDYEAVGIDGLGARMREVRLPAVVATFASDWLAPPASMEALLALTSATPVAREVFDAARLGDIADHFRWMKSPDALAAAFAGRMAALSP
jgi:predicted alpha/beta hydrolase